MNVGKLTDKLDFSWNKEELKLLKKISQNFIESLKNSIKKTKINAEVFVGGSFARGTLERSEGIDIDIFVRFDWKYEDLSYELEKIVKDISKQKRLKYKKVHGSRDYFKIIEEKIIFELIPVVKIKKPSEERNVTDLSYFHVNYIRKHLNEKMRHEVILLKKFCKAAKVYGAESYIGGFSGYALECLIVYYKTFEKTLKELIKVKDKERLVIDPAKHYKKKNDIFFGMNENKIAGPIILIDPTWKERNVLSALSLETLKDFQEKTNNFLKNPNERYFILEEFNEEKFKKQAEKNNTEFVKITLETDRQEGDIAGTKMKKFSRYITADLKKYFEILEEEFIYQGGKSSSFYLLLKSKNEIIKIGPPLEREEDVKMFKKVNKNAFEKNGYVHVKMIVDFSAKSFLEDFARIEKGRKLQEMGITGMRVEQ